jgi:hypothetical protein
MRVYDPDKQSRSKINFRPWHIVWISQNGIAPLKKQYSHRCHQENCVNPIHGVWEDDYYNKDRNGCKSVSHIIMPDESIIQICPHNPCCLTPIYIKSWNDDKFIMKGSDIKKLSPP